MDKIAKTIILAAGAIAALIWACSYGFSGLAWFPGALVATICGLDILDVNKNEEQHNG